MMRMSLFHASRLQSKRGFVFIVALGVMAILIVITATANMAAVNSYHKAGEDLKRAQANLLLESSIAALTRLAPSAEPKTIFARGGQKAGQTAVTATVKWDAPLKPDDPIYPTRGLGRREGDITATVTVKVEVKGSVYERAQKVLWNTKGQLPRPIYLAPGN